MTTKPLYRYIENNQAIYSLEKPTHLDSIEYRRLIADENKALTADGEKLHSCIDVEISDIPNWYEVDKPEMTRPRRLSAK